ncbi:MADS-box domain-containing protein [Aphelenchoides besseyi]|nr:MADS-box domain-containing protein [Aphelenchoides besseyi]
MAAGDSEGSKESTPQAIGQDDLNGTQTSRLLPNGKKTKGRVKIKMEYIGNKLRRYTTFSKRKTGIMKKAHELSTLTGTQVMLLVASETGHCYGYATNKLKPLIGAEPGKSLIQSCLNAPDDAINDSSSVKTEFTFEPSNGLMATTNTRKRKIGASEINETMSLPTMVPVSSASPDQFGGSDNDSDCEDEICTPNVDNQRVDASQLQRSIQEAFRMAAEQRQRPNFRRPKETNRNAGGRSNRNVDSNSQSLDWLLPLLLQEEEESKPTVLFQLPQGTVYASSEPTTPPSSTDPISFSASGSNNSFVGNGSHSSPVPSTSPTADDSGLQQLLSGFSVSNSGITLQQLLALSQLNNDNAKG